MERLRHKNTEQVILILLDSKNRLIHDKVLSLGTVNASLISPREILIYALREEAGGIMLLHNHPSGDPTPSKQDIIMTRRIKEVSDLIDIPLIDHIVIGDKRYTSFKQKGLL
jgi:DNA repair protein RadC